MMYILYDNTGADINQWIYSKQDNSSVVDIMSLDNHPDVTESLHKELLAVHRDFIGNELIEPVAVYGIRSYKNGSHLTTHVDRIETHHVSSIIIVDKKVTNDWPLDIMDHAGNWHKVYANVGDMILYESAVCEHGRKEAFQGEFFRNLFIHYQLVDYRYAPAESS
jgi:hypothetical protein